MYINVRSDKIDVFQPAAQPKVTTEELLRKGLATQITGAWYSMDWSKRLRTERTEIFFERHGPLSTIMDHLAQRRCTS